VQEKTRKARLKTAFGQVLLGLLPKSNKM